MTTLTNLFDLSPRELTNSAFWAWLLDGLRDARETPRRRCAQALLGLLKVPLPERIFSLQTERTLHDGRRLDVSLEAEAEGKCFHLFIENKVRPDPGLCAQVQGYCEALHQNTLDLYPVFFRSYAGGGASLMHQGPWSVREFDIDEMIRLLDSLEAEDGTILKEFLSHLRGRQAASRRTRDAIVRGGADPEMWLAVAQQNQVEHLFALYLSLAEETGSSRTDFNQVRSVALRYTSQPGRVGNPVLSLHLRKSSSEKGLRIGIHDVNWERTFSRPFSTESLPANFADEPDPQQPHWHFGYFRDSEELQRLFNAVPKA